VWTENVNRAFEVAARIKAGVIWINSTNMFDAAAGFGGYRESGFGREGGREGLSEYRIADEPKPKPSASRPPRLNASPGVSPARNVMDEGPDRTAKLYVGGKQARPDSGYSYAILDSSGRERSDWLGSAIARTSATPSRPPRRLPRGERRRRTIAPRCSITWPRTWRPAKTSSRGGLAR
jgi:hypothetical protein